MDAQTYLRQLFPTESYQRPINIPEDLDALEPGEFLAGLNDALDPIKRRLSLLTLPRTKHGIHTKWLRRAGGNCAVGDSFSQQPALAWCPRCLLTDRLEGDHQFLRLSWRMITRTFCVTHRRPLTSHCLECNDRQAGMSFIIENGIIALACAHCGSFYANQLGLPDMSAHTAKEVGRNNRAQAAWNNTIQFEKALEASLSDRSKKKNKSEFHDFAFAFANILMKSRHDGRAPIDLFASAAFPARRNPRNITAMDRPYRASSMAVQRKTHGLMAALLKCRVNLFSIKGLEQARWGRDPTFQELRADLEPEQNAELDRLLLRFPAKWF
ncbi:hypothetical protein RCCS2_00477 [Roseobacter sp. CCS2]|nr:hypothetical protein RCCS2_00477 [Roseobacter sp. CCS2]